MLPMITRILCDYDGEIPLDFDTRLQMVARIHRLRVQTVRFDKTRNGFHLVLECRNRISPIRVVLIQALLGSDWKRETFNSQRVMSLGKVSSFWKTRWNVLYHTHYRRVGLYPLPYPFSEE